MEDVTRILPDTKHPVIAKVVEDGWRLDSPQKSALAKVMHVDQHDPNYQDMVAYHAESCKACEDRHGILRRTEHQWILGGCTNEEASYALDIAQWEWRLHVMSRGLHLTRAQRREQIRAEMLFEKMTEEGERLPIKDLLTLMRDMDRAAGIGTPQMNKILAQTITNNTLSLQPGGKEQALLLGSDENNPYAKASDDQLKQIAAMLDELDC